MRLASDSYTEHTEAEASQALGDCVAWLDCSAPLCHCYICFDDKKGGGKMYYEPFMCALLIIGIICAVLFALVGEFILSFLCVLMSFVCICGLLFL